MRCAYVTLVMLGDGYVKGAVALAKSLLKSGTVHDLVCMVTEDVTKTQDLKRVFTHVIAVPYVYFKCGKMLTERQQKLYGEWIDFSFTKWRCLELIMYDKCVYLDADQIVLRNIDHLFRHSYAMCFNYNYSALYKVFKYGDVIDCDVQKFILENHNLLGFTGTFVYTPSLQLMSTILSLLTPTNILLTHHNKFNNGFDEVVLAQALVQEKIDVVQLTPMYVWSAGDYSVLKGQPYVINFYGDKKPWVGGEKTSFYMDTFIWKYFYQSKVH
ncbi:ORF47 P13 [Cydia pomonella granulovirus]|uniref:ORF47 P13 n=2 Tax=Cydia pomonella granulosis virus TaxID=28289 RepID=Q91F08_GVCPM|nr:ORF47 P13 [Cydia pomonella granulovirus]AAK70707.1 ORF47 P13 [Cydia pomonella granulovirus]AIU36972.1 ORF47 p13 [Cydia pomonella granulovirus]AIU37114.1 ORF47 p13 [Cydia pomonella granulovirus]QGY99595.1 p13 [Cydia pomonella granulovirus]QGY99737.1 p13 [Cydia pomonella granulovirus]